VHLGRGNPTVKIAARRRCHRDDCDCATPNGCARSIHQSDQDSRSSSRARVIQIRNDLAPKDANRRSARLAEINNTAVGETTVLRAVYFESNDAESEGVATMPIEAWRRAQTFLLSFVGAFEIRKINETDIFRPVRLPIQSPGC
jgi:hypothetical protein